jgi:deazaflavin-dependent oxidoreductase (nitroreductase family)
MTAPPTRLRFIRPITNRVVNPVTRRVAGRLPGFAILTHVGRTSGRTYRTPLNVFRRGNQYLFALTYGSDVQWLKNVLAAGECTIRTLGRDVRLVEPEVAVDPTLEGFPLPVRLIAGRLAGTTEVLRMRRAEASPTPARR